MKYIFYISIITIILSCERYYEMDLPEIKKCIVFEGVYTNQNKTCVFTLSRTTPYKYKFDKKYLYEDSALMIISDDLGNTDTLLEIYTGRYATNPEIMIGKIGRSYKLDIFTTDGKHYVSKWEKLASVPKIDTAYVKVDKSNRLQNSNLYLTTFYASWQDPKDTSNYIMNFLSYYWDGRWHDTISWCYIFNDISIDGKYLKDRMLFTDYGNNYRIKMNFYSLTKENYDYWQVLYEQRNPEVDAEVNASAPLIGNIYNVNDSKDYALGYFQVSATSSYEISINY